MKKRVFSLFVAIVMLVSTFGYMPVVAADASYLAFTSDIHNTGAATSNDTGANNLTNWLANIPGIIGGTFEVMGFCGDNGDSNTNGDTYWSRVQTVMDVVDGSDKVAESIFINGNHEHQNGSQSSSSNATAKKIKGIGYTKEATDYIIYVFGAASQSQSFNQSDITNLDNYLKNVAKTMPVFVMSHFPLHYDSNRTTSNAQALLDVLNKYPNVIFLWGHNHTNSDSHYDEVYLAGDTIKLTSSGSEKEINFTYAAAGCMGNTSYAHAVQADGLVAKVDGSAVTLTYYSGSASVVGTAVTVDVSTGSGTVTPDPDPDPTPDVPEADGTFTKATSIEAGKTYVITAAGMGMNGTAHSGYVNSSNYAYSGFAGTAVTASNDKITSTVTKDMLWTAESVSGGFAFKNENNGQYLAAFYEGQNGDNGIKFSTTAEAWTLSSSKLKSVTASSSASSDKFLAWDTDSDVNGGINNASGTANLFTVRSSSNADNVTLYVANGNVDVEDPTPDTPVTPDPDPDPTPDVPEADGTFTKATSIEAGKTYVITAAGMGMNGTAHSG
ncbi:MAG: metallophosphoesterase, partial [Clostridia bacterium]|nr:metallophosphoesterase [Clostridia bacterium]